MLPARYTSNVHVARFMHELPAPSELVAYAYPECTCTIRAI